MAQSSDGDESDGHLAKASDFIHSWMMDNQESDEVIAAGMKWADKHDVAPHNGKVIVALLRLGIDTPEIVLLAVRWLTENSMHQSAPDVVSELTARQ